MPVWGWSHFFWFQQQASFRFVDRPLTVVQFQGSSTFLNVVPSIRLCHLSVVGHFVGCIILIYGSSALSILWGYPTTYNHLVAIRWQQKLDPSRGHCQYWYNQLQQTVKVWWSDVKQTRKQQRNIIFSYRYDKIWCELPFTFWQIFSFLNSRSQRCASCRWKRKPVRSRFSTTLQQTPGKIILLLFPLKTKQCFCRFY